MDTKWKSKFGKNLHNSASIKKKYAFLKFKNIASRNKQNYSFDRRLRYWNYIIKNISKFTIIVLRMKWKILPSDEVAFEIHKVEIESDSVWYWFYLNQVDMILSDYRRSTNCLINIISHIHEFIDYAIWILKFVVQDFLFTLMVSKNYISTSLTLKVLK